MTRDETAIDPPRPPHFPEEEFVPESVIHLIVRTFLYDLLRFVLSGRAFVGSDQFVYFDGADPKRCLAPDVYMQWGAIRESEVRSWKVWERGTPPLCIEIDNSAVADRRWSEKLAHYRSLGVNELVYFIPEADPGRRLRVWDRIDDELVERAVEGDTTQCRTLGMQWVVRAIEHASIALSLTEDAEGRVLVLNRAEHAEREREVARLEAEREREAANARIAELEAELRRRGRS